MQGASIGEPFRWHDVLVNPQGPLPHVLLRAWTAVAGAGDLSLRSWAAVGGVLGLGLAMLAFRRARPRAALLAVWLLALSPFHIWYSQEVRDYAYLLAASALALWTFVRLWERPGRCGMDLACRRVGHAPAVQPERDRSPPRARSRTALRSPGSSEALAPAAAVAILVALPWLRVEFAGHVEWSEVVPGSGRRPCGRETPSIPARCPSPTPRLSAATGSARRCASCTVRSPLRSSARICVARPCGSGVGAALAAAARGWREPEIRRLFWWAFLPALGIAAGGGAGAQGLQPPLRGDVAAGAHPAAGRGDRARRAGAPRVGRAPRGRSRPVHARGLGATDLRCALRAR